MTIEVKTKKWGNSLGIVIPNHAIEKLNLRPDENILIEINKKDNALKELFGILRHNKKTTEQILKEARKDLEDKWSR